MSKVKIVYVGNGQSRYTLKCGKRITFERNIPKEIEEEDAKYLLKLRGKACRCHNEESKIMFVTYKVWKEYRVI